MQERSTNSDRMSKLSGATMYNVRLGENFTIGIIDTAGFGDTSGLAAEAAHMKNIIDSLEDINCVCLVIKLMVAHPA